MATFNQFQANAGAVTKTVTATTTTARYTMPTNGHGAAALRSYIEGSVPVFIIFGNSTVNATLPATDGSTSGSMPLGPGAIEILTQTTDTHFAVITASSTAKVHLTPGQGA
jgi:hypothetical protein